MRTKGAKNRTPEERTQIAEDRKTRAAARVKLPSNRQKLVLDAIQKTTEGVSLDGITLILHEAGHLLKRAHVKSIVHALVKKGLVTATVKHTTYSVPTT